MRTVNSLSHKRYRGEARLKSRREMELDLMARGWFSGSEAPIRKRQLFFFASALQPQDMVFLLFKI